MSRLPYYRCEGDVRGSCGVRHRTLEAAARCCARDQRACRGATSSGYSDRLPCKYVGGGQVELTDEECDVVRYMMRGAR